MTPTQQSAGLLNGERLIGMIAAAKLLPGYRENSHLNGSTIFRWITRGTKSASGKLVRLEAVRLGTRWFTSAEAIVRFSANCTEADEPPTTVAIPPPRIRPDAAASAELDRLLGTRKPR